MIARHFHGHFFLWKYMEYEILALCTYLAFPLCTLNLCPSMQGKNSKSSCYAFFLIPVHQKPSKY